MAEPTPVMDGTKWIRTADVRRRLNLTKQAVLAMVARGALSRQPTPYGFYLYDAEEVNRLAEDRKRKRDDKASA